MELGLAADVGTLQRLPKIVGNQSWVRDIVYTARKVSAEEAFQFGLVRYVYPPSSPLPLTNVSCSTVSQVCTDKEDTFSNAIKIAEDIASKSPVAVQGSKINMNYSRDHTVDEGLHFAVSLIHCLYSRPHYCFCSMLQVVWNSTMLQSEDVGKAIMAAIQKEKAIFSKL